MEDLNSVMHCFTDEKKALRLQACQEFIQSVDGDNSLLDSTVETWFSSMIPKQRTKHGMVLAKLSNIQKVFISEVQQQSNV
jgi:hypothetical protein